MKMIARNPNRHGLMFQHETIVAAAHSLKTLGHSGIDRVMLDLGLDYGTHSQGLEGRANALADFVIKNPDQKSPRGTRLDVAVVSRAAHLLESSNQSRDRVLRAQPNFRRQLESDGVVISATNDESNTFDPDGDLQAADPAVNVYEPFRIIAPDSEQDGGLEEGEPPEVSDEEVEEGLVVRSSGAAHGEAILRGEAIALDIAAITGELLTRIEAIDGILRELVPVAREVAKQNQERDDLQSRLGHNNPPPDAVITLADLEETAAAANLAQDIARQPKSFGKKAIVLCEKVFTRVAVLTKWAASQAQVFAEAAVKSAGEQTGKRAVDAVYYAKMFTVLGIALAAAAGLLFKLI